VAIFSAVGKEKKREKGGEKRGKEERKKEEERIGGKKERETEDYLGRYCSGYYIGQMGHSMNCINTKYS
jgi:hypothetical protein